MAHNHGILIGLLGAGTLAIGILLATSAPDDLRSPPAAPGGPSPLATTEPSALPVVGAAVERIRRPRTLPIRVALDLVRAAALDGTASDPPLGSNRTARLAGQLIGSEGEPIAGEVRFVAGPNQGRATRTDATGRFAAVDLHPGLSVVEACHAAQCLARRELRLAAAAESRFHLTLAQPGRVAGRVVDAEGLALPGARVRIDGQSTLTDPAGAFDVAAVPSGDVLVEVTAAGYAAARRRVSVAPGQHVDVARLQIATRREARLQIALSGHDRRPARVWILPAVAALADDTPWDRFGDLALGSEPLEMTGLPPGPVHLFAHRIGASLVGGLRALELVADARVEVAVELAPTTVIAGRARCDGRPAAGARVELCAADPLARSAAAMQLPPTCFAGCVLPLLPPAREQAISDGDGAFVLTGGETGSPWRELRVATPGGRSAVRAMWQGETQVDVELAHKRGAVGRMVFDFGQDAAELSVEVVVQGEPWATHRLSPRVPLVLDDLPSGEWRVQVSTGVVDLLLLPALHLEAERRCRVAFPPGVVALRD